MPPRTYGGRIIIAVAVATYIAGHMMGGLGRCNGGQCADVVVEGVSKPICVAADGVGLEGRLIKIEKAGEKVECEDLCVGNAGCSFYTFHGGLSRCYIFADKTKEVPQETRTKISRRATAFISARSLRSPLTPTHHPSVQWKTTPGTKAVAPTAATLPNSTHVPNTSQQPAPDGLQPLIPVQTAASPTLNVSPSTGAPPTSPATCSPSEAPSTMGTTA
eukprot:TRINITY_DN369_c0_g2_i1.p1 TRINITY_DN369_c0_g2~~TRINITY_DN369_c0_g2_i1.p1  ORF type:complete len:218 (+),score=8.97 TRINITY_DN369_c0_g2_i1:676-1329(+)